MRLGETAIVFAAALDGQVATDLYVVDGATVTRLTQTSGAELYPALSPDRTRIAFVRDFQLFTVDASGRNERLIAPMTGRQRKINNNVYSTTIGPAAWSPDGTQLAYPYPQQPLIIEQDGDQVDESGGTNLHVIGADGANDHLVGEEMTATINSIGWHGDTLSFSLADDCPDCAGGQHYGLIKTDGTGFRDVYFFAGQDPSPNKHLDWSPDGTHWAFVVGGGYFNYDEPGMVFTSTAEVDDEHALVTASSWNPRWSAAGTEIAYIGADGIYVVSASGDTPRRVLAVTGVRGLDW